MHGIRQNEDVMHQPSSDEKRNILKFMKYWFTIRQVSSSSLPHSLSLLLALLSFLSVCMCCSKNLHNRTQTKPFWQSETCHPKVIKRKLELFFGRLLLSPKIRYDVRQLHATQKFWSTLFKAEQKKISVFWLKCEWCLSVQKQSHCGWFLGHC